MKYNDFRIAVLVLLGILITSSESVAQNRVYFIGFTDRNNSPYSLQQPLHFLSQRAVDRRVNQGIALADDDLPVNPSYIDSIISLGAQHLNSIKWMNGITVLCDSNTLNSVLSLPFVGQYLAVRRLSGPKRVSSKFETLAGPAKQPSIVSSLSAQFDYGAALRQIDQINGDVLHQTGFTGSGMRIATIDAGFNSADQHPAFDSLFASSRVVATWDFVDRQNTVYEDDSHGTSVLSCMASNIPGVMVGTAPHAEYVLLRSEDANTEYVVEEYNWAAAAAYADSAGCDLITSSLGYFYFDDGAMDHSYADMDGNTTPISRAADIAATKGMLVLSSAGNTGNSSWRYIVAPADADSILSVGAVDSAGYKAGLSAFGPSVDGRIKPEVAAMGARTEVGMWNGTFGPANGTSFSCPVLAGAAACLWQAHPDKTNMEIRQAILESSSYYNNPGDSLGFGIPDFQNAHLFLGGTTLNVPVTSGLREVYPIPAYNYINVDYHSSRLQNVIVKLFDIEGREMIVRSYRTSSGNLNSWRMELSDAMPSGTYVLRVDGDDQVFFRKITVVR
ncbi:MAG: S8 family serine peptidase [Bacteroidota bacterium]